VLFDRVQLATDFGHRAGAAREPASGAEAETGAGMNGSGAGQPRRAEAGARLELDEWLCSNLDVDRHMCTANRYTTVGNGLEIFCQPGLTFPCWQ